METLIACALAHVVAPGGEFARRQRSAVDGQVGRRSARIRNQRGGRPGFRHDDRGYAASPNEAEAGVAPSSLIGLRRLPHSAFAQKSNAQMRHQVKCSNSCWWTYAESTSGRRS